MSIKRTVYGVGYISKFPEARNNKFYYMWNNMLRRCYSPSLAEVKVYEGCTVYEEWHDYANFYRWMEEHYYEVKGDKMSIDKDIIMRGNKEYSPFFCVIIPMYLNSMFNFENREKSSTGVVGVHERSGKYNTKIHKEWLGTYDTVEHASVVYKAAKKSIMLDSILNYRKEMPYETFLRLYNAIMRYDIGSD